MSPRHSPRPTFCAATVLIANSPAPPIPGNPEMCQPLGFLGLHVPATGSHLRGPGTAQPKSRLEISPEIPGIGFWGGIVGLQEIQGPPHLPRRDLGSRRIPWDPILFLSIIQLSGGRLRPTELAELRTSRQVPSIHGPSATEFPITASPANRFPTALCLCSGTMPMGLRNGPDTPQNSLMTTPKRARGASCCLRRAGTARASPAGWARTGDSPRNAGTPSEAAPVDQ
jgi:hypothetical protein